MNKLNNKGFTLVELLAVVVILLAISVIAIASISSAIERSKAKQDDAKKEVIISYAKLYFDEHKNENLTCVNVENITSLSNDDLSKADGGYFEGSVRKSDYKYCSGKNCTGTCS